MFSSLEAQYSINYALEVDVTDRPMAYFSTKSTEDNDADADADFQPSESDMKLI